MNWLTYIPLIFLLLACTAFFSASETAITAASRPRMHQLAKEGNRRAEQIQHLQNNLGLVISVVLMCNTLINSGIVALTTAIFIDIFGLEGVAYASAFMGMLILIYGEVMPKMISLVHPESFLLSIAPILSSVFRIFRFVNTVINAIARQTLKVFRFNPKSQDAHLASLEELKGAIDLHQGPGHDVPHERAMLKSILDLGSVYVQEIMVHRKDVVTVNADDSLDVIVDQVLNCPYTRLPVWQGNPENIIGVINAKVLLRGIRSRPSLNLMETLQKPWFVPENTDILEQLLAFRHRGEHFGIVVDEYGALLGIVTLEDILEEIVGEIDDEHDSRVRGIQKQDDGSYLIDGKVTIRDLNREFEWDLPDDSAATLAGLLVHELRMIPEESQVFLLFGLRLEVIRKHRNQITLIKALPLKIDRGENS